ncbi:hypothetical protein A9Q74_07480 [Colwellia sp. 39_35_sub15_T18]|nr:hypothetical protein A9Q74_07480 [Colwellia sp. 39_35_sub15_T18]
MSKRMMTKLTTFAFALTLTLTLTVTLNLSGHTFNDQTDLLDSCMAVESNLPMNHSNHPCNAAYMQNKSWLSWFANDKKSAHLHFLDLVELLHYSFH